MTALSTRRLAAAYGDFQALFGIDFDVEQGEAVALIGSNGAGKSTFLKSITGLMGRVDGDITLYGQTIANLPAHEITRLGVGLVPEGRRIFPSLSVYENLLIGQTCGRQGDWSLDRVYQYFPVLKERADAPGMALSGGQQQMLAIGRALMANPDVLLCDEISLGLAPMVVIEIYEIIQRVAAEGLALVIVEQDVQTAMNASQRVYCLQEGRVTLAADSADLTIDQVTHAFFGTH